MKLLFSALLLFALPAPAEADEIDEILASGADLKITVGELAEIFRGANANEFAIERHAFQDVAGLSAEPNIVLSGRQVSCAVSQFQALKKVDWGKYGVAGAPKIKISLFTKRHILGNSLKPVFRGEDAPSLEHLSLLHVYHPEHDKCDVWDQGRIEAQLDKDFNAEKEKVAARQSATKEAEQRAADAKEKKQRLIELLQRSSLTGRAPAIAGNAGECAGAETICGQRSPAKFAPKEESPALRQPAFLGVVKAAD
jgi:hypothetical protein